MKSNTLPIPANIPLRWELFRGFGQPELLRSAVVMAVALSGAAIYCAVSDAPGKTLTALLVALFSGAICGGIFARQGYVSIYTYVVYSIQFARSQKRYDSIPEDLTYEYAE